MAHNASFDGPGGRTGLDRPSSSSSPSSSGISESPRESSVAFSLIASPTTRPDGFDGISYFSKTEEPEEVMEDQDDDTIAVKTEPGEPSSSITMAPSRRPRGRPRKVKSESQSSMKATTKGRTKTGCVTCRKRKKKCDERKPTCKNCEQNNVHCEGYPARRIWLNGKEKAAVRSESSNYMSRPMSSCAFTKIHLDRERWQQNGAIQLPEFIPSLEQNIDWKFYKHYENELSRRLNINPDTTNPFTRKCL
jgi:hypothetical protein